MSYRIGEVATLSRISTRTLHHYHHIGLLKPSMRGDNGYRLYSDGDLQRLQQIHFFKTLGFNLDDIAKALNNPAFDFHRALIEQRQQVVQKVEQNQKVLTLIDNTLSDLNEVTNMSNKTTSFSVFEEFDSTIYEEEVKQSWGNTDALKESSRRTKKYNDEDWKKIKTGNDEILTGLANLLHRGIAPQDDECIAAIDQYRLHIDRWYYPCSHKMQAGLGRMYVSDSRFKDRFEKVQAGLAQYICDACDANALQNI